MGRMVTVNTTVFATGENMRAEDAYEIAHTRLWERIEELPGSRLVSIDQQLATRPAVEHILDPQSLETTSKATSTVIVSLLAIVTYQTSVDANPTEHSL